MHLLRCKLRLLTSLKIALKDRQNDVQVNGPVRSCNADNLSEDIKVLKAVLTSAMNNPVNKGDLLEQLPNTVSVSFKGLIGHEIVGGMRDRVACSAGSACHSAVTRPVITSEGTNSSTRVAAAAVSTSYEVSEVMNALGHPREWALGTVRLSCGRYSTEKQMDTVAEALAEAAQQLWTAAAAGGAIAAL